MIMALNKSIT